MCAVNRSWMRQVYFGGDLEHILDIMDIVSLPSWLTIFDSLRGYKSFSESNAFSLLASM